VELTTYLTSQKNSFKVILFLFKGLLGTLQGKGDQIKLGVSTFSISS
jgi:hypothetical protein